MVVWGPAQGRVSPQGSPRMPMSYLPSLLSAAMRWSKVSEKYWKSAFCLCTSNPRMRFRNLLMEQSADSRVPQAVSRLPPCLPPLPYIHPPPSILEVPASEGLTLLHVQATGPGLTPANAH